MSTENVYVIKALPVEEYVYDFLVETRGGTFWLYRMLGYLNGRTPHIGNAVVTFPRRGRSMITLLIVEEDDSRTLWDITSRRRITKRQLFDLLIGGMKHE